MSSLKPSTGTNSNRNSTRKHQKKRLNKKKVIQGLMGYAEAKNTNSYKKWQSMTEENLESFRRQHPVTFQRRFKRGVPPNFRWQTWKMACDVETLNKDPLYSYKKLSGTPSPYAALIEIDIPRTFPDLRIFDAASQAQLFRILNAYANYHPIVGYCQGMNFVAGLLLLVSSFEEEEAFWVLVSLMKQYDLRGFYMEKFPLLKRYMEAFDTLCRIYLPDLHAHFASEGIFPPVYLHQWFLTLYVTSLPLRTVVVLWDYLLCGGLRGLLCFTVALLKSLKKSLLQRNFEEIVKYLKLLRFSGICDDVEMGRMLVHQAEKIYITEAIAQKIANVSFDAFGSYNDATNIQQDLRGAASFKEQRSGETNVLFAFEKLPTPPSEKGRVFPYSEVSVHPAKHVADAPLPQTRNPPPNMEAMALGGEPPSPRLALCIPSSPLFSATGSQKTIFPERVYPPLARHSYAREVGRRASLFSNPASPSFRSTHGSASYAGENFSLGGTSQQEESHPPALGGVSTGTPLTETGEKKKVCVDAHGGKRRCVGERRKNINPEASRFSDRFGWKNILF